MANKRKTTTSTEVKSRWNAKTYKRYSINLRKEEDADLIALIEKTKKENNIGITETFKMLLERE